jgi:hypothetical protein
MPVDLLSSYGCTIDAWRHVLLCLGWFVAVLALAIASSAAGVFRCRIF